MHPTRVTAVAGLSVLYRSRQAISQTEIWKQFYQDRFFYQNYFQEEGVVERELEADVRVALRKIYFSISGDAPSLDNWFNRAADGGMLGPMTDPDLFPGWITDDDLDYFVSNFVAEEFHGPINRYRNQQWDFDTIPEMGAVPVNQPSCFIAGSKDVVRSFVPGKDVYDDVVGHCSDMRLILIIEGPGHWVQQEAPDAVNAALLEFLVGTR
ncbi:alpha/beta hydrolase [Alphaproteobacteria bacterium]|nr:alpha/beta hydrolase [Alphaproteobacteria bacterium]